MRKIITATTLAAALAFSAGCAVTENAGPQLAYQYTTLKLLETENVTRDDVLTRVDQLRDILDAGMTLTESDFRQAALDVINYSELSSSQKLLINAFFVDTATDAPSDNYLPRVLTDERRAQIMARLAWIEQAASVY